MVMMATVMMLMMMMLLMMMKRLLCRSKSQEFERGHSKMQNDERAHASSSPAVAVDASLMRPNAKSSHESTH